jgi:bifunctional NMN adenylyltransferase/nudix hydrolase
MPKKSGTGIIIGRFQVFELNKVHVQLVASVLQKHTQVAIYLASNPAPGLHNPLDFELRRLMFEEKYKDKLRIEEMPDLPDDRIWSQELDRRILEIRPEGTVTLYGTQDNFIDRYSGRHKTEALEAQEDDFPEEPELSTLNNLRDFRAGMIYANIRRFPTVYPTVDIAVFRRDYTEVLLARKANETRYRFPGGFTDPTDQSYEDAVLRELGEECGELTIDELTYLGSCKIDDWRYRDAFDSIMTHMYACSLVDGKPSPSDDIAEVQWYEIEHLTEDLFVAEHRPLFEIMMDYLEELDEEEEED